MFEPGKPDHAITPIDDMVLLAVKELGICTQEQVQLLLGWDVEKQKKKAWEHLRKCFDARYLQKFELNASDFADPTKTRNLTFGRAPHVYALSQEGIDYVVIKLKRAEPGDIYLFPEYDPRNSTHVAHLVEVRNFRIWLELLKRHYRDHEGPYRWRFEPACHIDLERKQNPKTVRPDATVTYRLKDEAKVLCLLETDRGTETDEHWEAKHAIYATLYNTTHEPDSNLDDMSRGRLVVIVPTVARREWLYKVLSRIPESKRIVKRGRIWIAEKSILQKPDLREQVWRVVGEDDLSQFVPDAYL